MADKNIVIKSRNGSTWDNIYPVTKSENVIMSDSTTLEAKIATKQNSLGFTPENTTNKNKANGYAGLDANLKIFSSQLPSIAFSSLTSKPTTLSGYGIADATPSSHVGSGGSAHSVATQSTAGFISAADKTKLDALKNYSHPTGDGNLHVPATSTINNKKVLTAGETAGSLAWDTVKAADVVESTTKRFIADTERTAWNTKATESFVTTAVNNKTINTLSVKPDNWKDSNALPSTYDRGQTIFYSNNPTNKFNNIPYCTVVTIKGYSNMACTQYLYPYNDATNPIMFRHALYNTDAWQKWQSIATTDEVTTAISGLMSAADKVKLNGIATNANNYVHPANHPASIITQDASNRFVTDAEKTAWNAKASTAVATTLANGLMQSTDKTKLNGIATGANNYTHPTGSGNNHIPTGGATGQYLKYSAAGVAAWSTPTKSDVGLNNVDNAKQATKSEFDAHVSNVTSQMAEESTITKVGRIQLATDAEVKAGTNATKAVTPATAKSSYLPLTGGDLTGALKSKYHVDIEGNKTARLQSTTSAGRDSLSIMGSGSFANGSVIALYGDSDSATPNNIVFFTNNVNRGRFSPDGTFTVTGQFYKGVGSPEGGISAPVGSIYQRTDGGINTTLYVKQTGTGNTGWIAK